MIRPGRKQTNWQPHGYQGFGFFIHGLWSGSPPDTLGRSPVRKSRTPGSVRGVSGNWFDRSVSADAAGIIITALAINRRIWLHYERGDVALTRHLMVQESCLWNFISSHDECAAICAALD